MSESALLPTLRILVALQELDSQIHALRHDRDELPELREALREEVGSAETHRSEAAETLEQSELEHRRLEGQLRDAEALIARLEGQSGNVSSNQAYTALLNEIEQARTGASESEDHVLEVLETIDDTRETLASASAALEAAQGRAESGLEEFAKREQALDVELERLQALRTTTIAPLDRETLARYDRIGRRHTNRLATLSGKVCSGCRIVIPAQHCSNVKTESELISCLQCDRFLLTEATMTTAQGQ